MWAGREIPHVIKRFIAVQCSDHRAAPTCLNRVYIWRPLGTHLRGWGLWETMAGDYGKEGLPEQ